MKVDALMILTEVMAAASIMDFREDDVVADADVEIEWCDPKDFLTSSTNFFFFKFFGDTWGTSFEVGVDDDEDEAVDAAEDDDVDAPEVDVVADDAAVNESCTSRLDMISSKILGHKINDNIWNGQKMDFLFVLFSAYDSNNSNNLSAASDNSSYLLISPDVAADVEVRGDGDEDDDISIDPTVDEENIDSDEDSVVSEVDVA